MWRFLLQGIAKRFSSFLKRFFLKRKISYYLRIFLHKYPYLKKGKIWGEKRKEGNLWEFWILLPLEEDILYRIQLTPEGKIQGYTANSHILQWEEEDFSSFLTRMEFVGENIYPFRLRILRDTLYKKFLEIHGLPLLGKIRKDAKEIEKKLQEIVKNWEERKEISKEEKEHALKYISQLVEDLK